MTNTNVQIRSEEVQEILEATPNWIIQWGNIIILALIIILFFISWFVKYPDIIQSSATLTTQIPPQKEYAKTTGKIAALLISDNAIVNSETPLAILENTANYKDIFLLKSIVDTIAINNQSFYFPFDQLPILFLGDLETDYAIFENNYLQYQLNGQYQPYSNEAQANQITKKQLEIRLNVLESQKQIQQSELDKQKQIFERSSNLFKKGIIAKQEFEQAEITYSQAKRNFINMDASMSNIKEAIANANKTYKATTINKTREEISLLKTVIQSFNQLKRSLKQWELQYLIKSNTKGKVSFSNTWTKNQKVSQGDLLFTIIPDANSNYIAYLKSPAQNSGKLKPGQDVNIKLQNYPDTEFGVLKGKVKQIALLPDDNGEYLISVMLPKTLITSYKKEIPFKHEMLGSAEIVTEDLRLIERFFYQLKKLINN